MSAIAALLDEARDEIGLKDTTTLRSLEQWANVMVQDSSWRAWVWAVGGQIDALLVFLNFHTSSPEVFYLVVSRNYRRQGIGLRLLEAAQGLAMRESWASLKARTMPDNYGVIALLRRASFEEEGPSEGWRRFCWRPPKS